MGVSNGVGSANATAVGVGNAIADDVAEYGSALGNYNSVNARGTALGNFNEVYGVGASAIGDNNLASGRDSSAVGNHSQATEQGASAFGYGNVAEGVDRKSTRL